MVIQVKFNGRQLQWKMTSMQSKLNERLPQCIDLNGKQPNWRQRQSKMTSMKDGLTRRKQPEEKTQLLINNIAL
jgi:hypothetical protein